MVRTTKVKRRVLLLRTGNSARSQMAALLRKFEVYCQNTEIFTNLVLRPRIAVHANGEDMERVQKRVERALESAQKYSLVANSVKSKVAIDPIIEVLP
jgi:protein-tyrosine-phosphatase